MGDMWKNRVPPVPLDFEDIREGRFTLHQKNSGSSSDSNANINRNASSRAKANGSVDVDMSVKANGEGSSSGSASGIDANSAKLKDQKQLTIEDCLELFVDRYALSFIIF